MGVLCGKNNPPHRMRRTIRSAPPRCGIPGRPTRAIVMAACQLTHDKPQTASWLEAVVELCHHVLWMGEWTGVHPPGMDSSAMLRHWRCLLAGHCTVAQLTCCELQASCPQLLAAWNRQTRAAEQLECCACRACQLRTTTHVAQVVPTLGGRAQDQHIVNTCRVPAGPRRHPVLCRSALPCDPLK